VTGFSFYCAALINFHESTTPEIPMSKIATSWTSLPSGMQKEIDYARRPMTQNPTPKRMRQYNSRVHDGNNWERGQRALRALADAHRAGTVPEILVG